MSVVAAQVGGALVISTVVLELAVAMTFLLGRHLTGLHFLAFVATLVMLLLGPWALATCHRRPARPVVVLAEGLGGLLIVSASFALAGSTFDLSPDGQTTHALAIGRLTHGWNPIYDPMFEQRPEDYVLDGAGNAVNAIAFKDTIAMGGHMASAAAYSFFGDHKYGKGFNLVLLFAAALLALAAALEAGVPRLSAGLLATVTALNPVCIMQALTLYVDGQIGSIVTCLLALTLLLKRRRSTLLLAGWGAAIILLTAVKMTGLAFAAALGVGTALYLGSRSPDAGEELPRGAARRRFSTILAHRRRLLTVLVAASVLGIGIVGFRPYVTNLAEYGDVFFPFRSRDTAEWIGPQPFAELETRSAKFLASIFSESAVNPPRYVLKVPFYISGGERESFRLLNPDHRAGGFGPWMGAAFLAACALLLLASILRRHPRHAGREFSALVGLAFLLSLVLGSVLLLPEPWWARFVPQAWLLPVLVCGFALRRGEAPHVRRGAQLLLLILAVNVSLVLVEHVRGQLALQSGTHRTMVALRGLPQPLVVYFGTVAAVRTRFHDYGVEYVEASEQDCVRYLDIVRSQVRVCRDPAGGLAWNKTIDEIRRIDADLRRAGVGFFQIDKTTSG